MPPPLKIRTRGITQSMDQGVVVGRSAAGTGDGQFLDMSTLAAQLAATGVLASAGGVGGVDGGQIVADLPAPGVAGRRTFVTDALAPVFLAPVAGSGAVVTPVFDDGTNWVCG